MSILHGLNYEPNVDDAIIVHNNDGVLDATLTSSPPTPKLC